MTSASIELRMKKLPTKIHDAWLLQPKVFFDARSARLWELGLINSLLLIGRKCQGVA
jgi:hypothetical protein